MLNSLYGIIGVSQSEDALRNDAFDAFAAQYKVVDKHINKFHLILLRMLPRTIYLLGVILIEILNLILRMLLLVPGIKKSEGRMLWELNSVEFDCVLLWVSML